MSAARSKSWRWPPRRVCVPTWLRVPSRLCRPRSCGHAARPRPTVVQPMGTLGSVASGTKHRFKVNVLSDGTAEFFIDNTNYDPYGRVIRATMGLMPNHVAITNSCDESTGRIRNTTFSKENGTSAVDNIDYIYNAAGSITRSATCRAGHVRSRPTHNALPTTASVVSRPPGQAWMGPPATKPRAHAVPAPTGLSE